MKVDSRAHKFFIISAFLSLPLVFLAGILTAGDRVVASWEAFSLLCSKTWDLMIGYTMHYDNFWSLFIITLFSLALLNALIYAISHLYKFYLLKKKLTSNIVSSKKGINVVKSSDLFAITAGFLKPQIYLSSGLFTSLTIEELKAVTAHERYHQRNFHPLYLLLSYSLHSLLFFLPVAKSLIDYISLKYEILADDFSIKKTSKKNLSSALYKMINQNNLKFPETVSTFSATKERVDILTGDLKPIFHIPKFLSVFSLAIIFFLSSFLLSPTTTSIAAADVETFIGIEENGYSVVVPVDCYSATESIASLVKFGQQSEANMTYVPIE